MSQRSSLLYVFSNAQNSDIDVLLEGKKLVMSILFLFTLLVLCVELHGILYAFDA